MTQKHRAAIEAMNAAGERETDWGGSAFPCEGGVDSGLHPDPGMSLRDWFATHAMQAALTNSSAGNGAYLPDLFRTVAKLSYMAADAMLAARSNSTGRSEDE